MKLKLTCMTCTEHAEHQSLNDESVLPRHNVSYPHHSHLTRPDPPSTAMTKPNILNTVSDVRVRPIKKFIDGIRIASLQQTKLKKKNTSLSYFKFAYISTSKHIEVRCPAAWQLRSMLQGRSVVYLSKSLWTRIILRSCSMFIKFFAKLTCTWNKKMIFCTFTCDIWEYLWT